MKTLQITNIDISPSKEKKVCQNCKNFYKFGVHLGFCSLKSKEKMDSNTCKNFNQK